MVSVTSALVVEEAPPLDQGASLSSAGRRHAVMIAAHISDRHRRGTQIKWLYFDRIGFCIWGKQLEARQFIGDWRRVSTGEMNWTGLKLVRVLALA